jgi:aryl-alcohol dehydrogenase-like predicted oxidoreductase
MRIDTVDLYLLHMFDPLTPLSDVAELLEALKDEGKIRAYGVSNHTVEQLRAHRRFGAYDAVQPAYSLLSPEIEGDLLPFCESENIGVMVYSPLHKGLLTGKYSGTETFSDFRRHHPDFHGDRFARIAEGVRSLKPMADKYGYSIYQLVLVATVMHPAIHAGIVGIKNPGQIEEALGAMGQTISREDYFAVRKALAIDGASKLADAKGKRK